MKLRNRLTALIAASAILFSLAACGGGGNEETKQPDPTQPTGQTETQQPQGEAGKKILFLVAQIGDFGIGDMGHRGCKAVVEKYGYDLTLVEYGTTDRLVATLVDALDTTKYDYVVTSAWNITDTIVEKSRNGGEWSDTTFILYDAGASDDYTGCDNIYGIAFAQNEGSFLAGIYASLMTQTGKVAAVINLDMPVTNDFGAGFIHGVKYAREELGKDVDMMYTYMGELTVQGDYESVNVVMDNGCDIVYNVGASVSLGAMQAADEKGGVSGHKLLIGTDYDQYQYFLDTGSVQGYETMSTSMLKNIDTAIINIFDDINGQGTGEYQKGSHVYGISTSAVGLVYNDHYKELTPEDVQKTMLDIEAKVTSGEIDVVSYFDFNSYDAFATYRDNIDAPFVP